MTRHQTPFTRPVGATRSAPAQARPRHAEPAPRPAATTGASAPATHPVNDPANSGATDPASGPITQTTSAALFAGAVEIQIDHHGTIYRLKHTALGKLILTK